MKKTLLPLLFILLQFNVNSQTLAAFNVNVRHFWAFEAGIFTELEFLEIQDYQVGGILIAYIDNSENLKIYRNGKVEKLIQGSPIKYTATDYLLGYSIYEQLNVYDNGKTRILSTACDGYIVQDSLIAWHDKIKQTMQIYYNGRVITVLDGLIYNPIKSFKAGDNTVAWVNSSTKNFSVFYQGNTIVLDDYSQEMNYDAGRDIVAFYDVPDQVFSVFINGEVSEIEPFIPKSYKVGDDMLAYVDNMDKLKYFDKDGVTTISDFEPKFYDVVDMVMVYEEQGFLKTFCNGEVYIIERYIPQPYKLDYNTIAYLDQSRFLKIFQPCSGSTITNERIAELSLIRDLIIFTTGINKVNIYFSGQVYKH